MFAMKTRPCAFAVSVCFNSVFQQQQQQKRLTNIVSERDTRWIKSIFWNFESRRCSLQESYAHVLSYCIASIRSIFSFETFTLVIDHIHELHIQLFTTPHASENYVLVGTVSISIS
uniref:Uncharacterized protein n=1 Tax=Leptocylindrus danicus TaxID=163516 RepID=A0A7S2KUW8_9STRA|mmetsp:Transcript_27415/g.40484  ORF Transcript_27415/g.40484 Transcript_27415/m.40484 type:complete len:116 (+) Transcript_27415:190-537(+)